MNALIFFVGLLVSITASAENRVLVIDTGLDIKATKYQPFLCKDGHRDFTGTGLDDRNGHGTVVVDLIIENARTKNFCLVIFKYFDEPNSGPHVDTFVVALKNVAKAKPKLVNVSVSGEGFRKDEFFAIRNAGASLFVVAAGNDNVDLLLNPRYPANYPLSNVVVVGALDPKTGEKEAHSNYGQVVSFWERATSTSYATAIKTGKIVNKRFGANE
jgi:subtilisin family serine protease